MRRLRLVLRSELRRVAIVLVVTAAFCAGASAAEQDLVAHWTFDDGKGKVLHDRSGNNHGKIQGAKWVPCGKAYALKFDGVDDYVSCGKGPALDVKGPITLSAWVLAHEAPAGEIGICGKHFSSYLLSYYKDLQTYWYIGSGGNNRHSLLLTGSWSHVAGTFDGKTMRLHVNGTLTSERRSKFDRVPSGGNFIIGAVVGDPQAEDINYQQSGFFKGFLADVRLYSRALTSDEIHAQYAKGIQGRFGVAKADVKRMKRGVTVSADGLTLRVGNGGRCQVETEGSFFIVHSTFSYPAEKIGTNGFSDGQRGSERKWRPRVRRIASNAIRISAKGGSYTLTRTLTVRNGRVCVEDAFTNTSRGPVGVRIKHQISMPKSVTGSRIGIHPADPVVFAATPDYDLGLVAEDFLSRAQFSPFCTGNALGFRLSRFGIAGGKSHTFRWTIYPLDPSGDPFALINRIRADHGANHAILGPCSFFDASRGIINDPQRLKRYLQRRKLGIAMLCPWLDYDPNQMSYTMPRDEYKAMMQRAYKALKAANPDIKVIGSIECDWVGIFPDRIKNGDKLPRPRSQATGAAYLTPEQAKILYDAKLPWNDSLKLDAKGRPVLELYVRGGKPQWALGVYPAPGNYQAKFLLEQAKFLVEDVGLDGWYTDEFSLFWVRSHDKWDGYTVDIDTDTGRILRKYTNANVAGFQPRLDLCNYAAKNGYTMVANTYATTVEESRLPIMRFAETWASFDPVAVPKVGKPPYFLDLAKSQLGTMIGLGINGRSFKVARADILMRGIICYLRHGMVYYHYSYGNIPESGEGSGEYGPINHMFPITPVRLFEGGIEGKERTITCVSGTYRWKGERPPRIFLFDGVGREKKHNLKPDKTDAGWEIVIDLRDWQEIAVIAE